MHVSVFGLGYVGAVTSACLSSNGHHVIGVDVSNEKVARILRGESPIVEPGLQSRLSDGVAAGTLTATTDPVEAVLKTSLSMISVGTPPSEHGRPDLGFVFAVCEEIGRAVALKGIAHTVVIRSTIPPGTLSRCAEILGNAAGAVPVHVAFNPEFLREGSAIADYYAPPYTIIGTEDPVAEADIRSLYSAVEADVYVVEPEAAEMIKYVANAWHATKIAFANEVGRVAKSFDVDGREVMSMIARDTKLNVSAAYMRPGFAYGGSCLPKDLDSLLFFAHLNQVSTPLLASVPKSNDVMIESAVQHVLSSGARTIAVMGLAFKSGTDDLRESPSVKLCKRLIGEGVSIKVYDSSVYEAWLTGANLEYIKRNLPHFESLLFQEASEALTGVEMAVVTYSSPVFRNAIESHLMHESIGILDLAGVFDKAPANSSYYALGW